MSKRSFSDSENENVIRYDLYTIENPKKKHLQLDC